MAETIIPEGRGRAEAMRTFLATGGERVSRGGSRYPGYRYTQGALKGMTQEQAEAEFENRWAGASGEIKDKYARMASPEGVLSPSEMKRYQGPKPTAPKPPAATAPAAPTAPRPAPKPADISNEPGVSGMVQGPPTPAVSAEIAKRSTVVGPPATTAPSGYAGPTTPRINRLTGLPFGYQPGDKLPEGASPAMQSAAAGSARNMEAADQAPRATDAEAAAATRVMERDGAIPTKPGPTYAGPRPSKPMGAMRKDGYQATSQEQDWRRDERNVAAAAARRMTNEEAGFATPPPNAPAVPRTGFALARRR